MTRRDYCAVCSEMVNDWDPSCCNCGESFCYNCPSIGDNISRLVILYSKLYVLRHPVMTMDELKSMVEINPDEIITYCQEQFQQSIEKEYHTKEEVNDMLILIRNEFKNIKTNLILSDNISSDQNQQNVTLLKHFFDVCNHDCDIYFEFTCNMCHQGISIQY
jgi:hypothetical protein